MHILVKKTVSDAGLKITDIDDHAAKMLARGSIVHQGIEDVQIPEELLDCERHPDE